VFGDDESQFADRLGERRTFEADEMYAVASKGGTSVLPSDT
jgi:hypothetical protein